MTLTLLSMKYLQMKKRLTDTMPASIGEMNQDNTTNVKKNHNVTHQSLKNNVYLQYIHYRD